MLIPLAATEQEASNEDCMVRWIGDAPWLNSLCAQMAGYPAE